MTDKEQDILTTRLALGIDVAVVVLLQAHGCVVEQGDSCLWLTYPAGTTRVEMYPRVHAPRYVVTLPDGYQLEEHADVRSSYSMLYYQPPEEKRHPVRFETIFRYRPGQRVRLLVGPLRGQIRDVQTRQHHAGLDAPPRYLIAGDWYEEQDLVPAEDAPGVDGGEESGQ